MLPHSSALVRRSGFPRPVQLGIALLVNAGLLAATTPFRPESLSPASVLAALDESASVAIRDEVRAVARSPDGTLVVGSNILAVSDGARWQKIDLGGAYGFRALAAAGDETAPRVWVGAIGALGFLERDQTGTWHYRSLLNALAEAGLTDVADIWSVHPLGSGALWVSDAHAFRWTPNASDASGTFDIWHLPARSRLAAFGGGTQVWIHQEGIGLLRVTSDTPPTLTVPENELPAWPVTWLLPDNQRDGGGWIGLDDSAYRWTADSGFARNASLSDALHSSLPTAALALGNGRFAVSTINRGIVIASQDGSVVAHATPASGLPDRGAYSLAGDASHLWCASPQGLIRIDGLAHATFLYADHSLGGGRPLRSVDHAGQTYFLTTQNLVRTAAASSPHPYLETVLTAPATFSDVSAAGENLWVAGFGGLWRVDAAGARQEHLAPTDVVRIARTQRSPRGQLLIEGYDLKLLRPADRGGWVTQDLGARIGDSPVSLLEDGKGDVWVSTMQDGVTHFAWQQSPLDSRLRLRTVQHFRPGVGLPRDSGRIELTRVGPRLFAFSDAGILVLRRDQLGFEPVAELASFNGIATRPPDNDHSAAHWIVQSRLLAGTEVFAALRVEAPDEGSLHMTEITAPGLDTLGRPTRVENHGSFVRIASPRGVLQLDESILSAAPAPHMPLLSIDRYDERTGSATFAFSLPAAVTGEPVFFQTRLVGTGADWSPATTETSRHLDALGAGAYRFEVRAMDRFGRTSPAAAQRFVVPAPWWRTAPALLLGGAVLVLLATGATRWQVIRLRRQNQALNRLVAERTREIELASTAKSEFLDNVSHELRNPLNGLTGLLAMLDDARLDPRQRELTRSLKAIGATLTQVFEEVLQFSKLEYGYGRAERRPFALRALLDEIVAFFTLPARQAGCSLAVHWPPALVDGFEGDPDKIRTILSNFVGNAVKYAPGQPIELRVDATGETHGLVDLYIDVIDHGPGVPADEHELIFKKFVRGKHARDSETPGTGLGLATCRMTAKLINATVGLDTTPGGGSTFHLKLLLPRHPLPAPVAAPRLDLLAKPWTGLMLVVDDEDYNRVVLQNIVNELGATAHVAGTVADAIRLIAAHDFNVLLLDWELPDGTGGDIAQHVRQRGASHPLMLATTAHDSDEMRRRCHAAGMHGFLVKPYTAASLSEVLSRTALNRIDLSDTSTTGQVSQPAPELDLRAFNYFQQAHPGDPDAARRLYVEAIDTHLSRLSTAHASGDTATLAREAHQLRALAGLLNAIDLNRVAARLEDAARNDPSACTEAWQDLQRECERLKQHLSALRESPSDRSRGP